MPARNRGIPIALTIAGSDSGGGAGVQADLKTFAALGVHGASVITCITAQNPGVVHAIQPVSARLIQKQLEAVFEELPPGAVKTGMLFSTRTVRIVVDFFKHGNRPPLIVDPVMVATSGASLLKPSAARLIQKELLPLARLVTPNLIEAGVLLGRKLRSAEDQRRAAREIHSRYGCGALVKGGHWRGTRQAVDIFFDGHTELLLQAPFIRGVATHGTGCTCSAAVAASIALGQSVPKAVVTAKEFITRAISQSRRIGKHSVLNWFWNARNRR